MQDLADGRPVITKLWAKNFRSLHHTEVDLEPLTALVGPNASGKSNVVDVLRFVADALRNGLDSAVTARHGVVAMRRWSAKGRPFDIDVGLAAMVHKARIEYEFTIGSASKGLYAVKRERLVARSRDLEGGSAEFEVRNGKLVTPRLEMREATHLPLLFEPTAFETSDLALREFTGLFPRLFPSKVRVGTARSLSPPSLNPARLFYLHLTRMRFYHIFPNMFREPQKPGTPYPLEERGENLASVLRGMRRDDGRFFADLRDALGKVVPGVSDVDVSQVGGYLVVKLKHEVQGGNGKGAWFDLSQESDGTLRLLGLLVALFQDPVPSLIAVEEPELTIHPGALAVLADLLKEATQRTQVLITTHSPELIDHLPVESLRAVESVTGVTNVGLVASHQREAVRQGLFSAGELHRIEGLERARAN